jgi:hypothetical protein
VSIWIIVRGVAKLDLLQNEHFLMFLPKVVEVNKLSISSLVFKLCRLQFPVYPLEELGRVEWDHTMVNFLLMLSVTRRQFYTEVLVEIHLSDTHHIHQKIRS